MKKTQTLFFVIALISIFTLSFLIGRATALHDNDENSNNASLYGGTVPLPKSFVTENEEYLDVTAKADNKVKKNASQKEEKQKVSADTDKKKKSTPLPERMLFPCGNTVLKQYSQTAVYSETMDDWRAHTGIDFAAEEGSNVYASYDGVVTAVYKDKLWGYTIEITHTENLKSYYKNLLKKIPVKEGQAVKGGEIIGAVGKSAAVEEHESAHLHFEIHQDGIVINPETYIY